MRRRRVGDPFTIAGIDARTRLRRAIEGEQRLYPETIQPSDAQIAMVLHALADHTSLMVAVNFESRADDPWPVASSVGRFLHFYGDYFDEHRLEALP